MVRWDPRVALCVVTMAASVLGCNRGEPPVSAPNTAELERVPGGRRLPLRLTDTNGISGLTAIDGTLWAVPERVHVLLELDDSGGARAVPLAGVSADVDLEAIAAIAPHRFALGTEDKQGESGSAYGGNALIYLAEVEGNAARVTESIAMSYELWKQHGVHNEGIEGLCAAGGRLVIGIEATGLINGRRFAPVASYDLATKKFTAYWLLLSSETGKISAMTCREHGGRIEVLAVERNFGVARLLRFELPDTSSVITPRVERDLESLVNLTKLNFEGIAWRADGAVVLAVDNQWKEVTGPNELIILDGP